MIQLRRGTHTQRASSTDRLASGQPFYEIDTNKLYIGDGNTLLKNLTAIVGDSEDITTIKKNAINIIKVDTSFNEDFAIFALTDIVFPMPKTSIPAIIASLPEPYKTYLTQLSQVHPLADWENNAQNLIIHLQESSYNYIIDNSGCIGIVVGFVNSQTMLTTNPDSIAAIRIVETNFMEKFGEVYGSYGSGLMTIDTANNLVLRDQAGNGFYCVSENNGGIRLQVKNNVGLLRTELKVDGDGVKLNDLSIVAISDVYPVGFIMMTVDYRNPSTYIAGLSQTTWIAWGQGQVPIGVDTSQTEFNAAEKTGGEKTHTLTRDEMPKHDHYLTNRDSTKPTYISQPVTWESGVPCYQGTIGNGSQTDYIYSTDYRGNDQPHNNLQPYITCYMWKRVA